jgi:hypothetical protein
MEDASLQVLLKHYTALLELYANLEAVSLDVCSALESGSNVGELTAMLKENAVFADRIREESHTIAAMKKSLVEHNLLSESERTLVKEAEAHLYQAVNRVVEQETRNHELMMKQGVKISRR